MPEEDRTADRFVTQIMLDREELVDTILAAAVVALGIALIATFLFDALPRVASGAIGLICTAGPLIWIARRRLRRGRRSWEIAGFVLYDQTVSDILSVEGYEFATSVRDELRAAFFERPDLFLRWLDDPLEASSGIRSDGRPNDRVAVSASMRLLAEVSEYIALDLFVTHVQDFFNQRQTYGKHVRSFSRKDIDPTLFSNRLLDLFTSDSDERPALRGYKIGDADVFAEGVGLESLVGPISYRKLEFTLPTRSRLVRRSADTIVVDHPSLSISLRISVGSRHVVPLAFLKQYIGLSREEALGFPAWRVAFLLETVPTWRGLLSPQGWRLHMWAESLLDRLATALDADRFFTAHGWSTAETILRAVDQHDQSPTEHSWGLETFLDFQAPAARTGPTAEDRELANIFGFALVDREEHAISAAAERLDSMRQTPDRTEVASALRSALDIGRLDVVATDYPISQREFLELIVATVNRRQRAYMRAWLRLTVLALAACGKDQYALDRAAETISREKSRGNLELAANLGRIIAGDRSSELLAVDSEVVKTFTRNVLRHLPESDPPVDAACTKT
jgi:hypothetical protein